MAAIDITSAAKIIKFLYPDYTVPRELRKNNPFYSLLKKNTNFVGKSVEVPLTINSTQGGGATFAGAKTASEAAASYANTYASFTLTRKTDYSLATIGGEAMKAAVKDQGAMVDLFQDTMDLSMFTAMRSISRHLFRDGTGTIGRIAVTTASPTFTLSTPSDAYNFSIGERISVFSGTGGSAFMYDTEINSTITTPLTVTAVDRKAGTVTLSSGTSIAAGHYLARATDRTLATNDATVFTNSKVITGVKQWLAGSATGAAVGLSVSAFLPADLYGVTRTTDKSSLAGSLLDCTGASPDEAILQLVSDISAEGGMPDHCFMNPRDFAALNKFLGSRVVYGRAENKDEADFGFQSIVLQGDAGPVKCVSDINVPQSEIFALQLDTWDLFSLNAAPHILDYDQNNFLRVSDDDAYQIRIGSYANLRCRAPGFNGRGNNYLATTVY